MNFDASKASSFDPYDYYKKLTRCLAAKNNRNVDLSKIPRLQAPPNNIRRRLITRQDLQAQLLAKYEERVRLEGRNSQKPVKSPPKIKVKFNPFEMKKKKKKAPDPIWLNLPPSFFGSMTPPEVTIFKKPKTPPPKVMTTSNNDVPAQNFFTHRKLDNFANEISVRQSYFDKPQPPSSANSTMSSLTSAKFNPQQASTPFKEPQPIIADPDEYLKPINRQREISQPPVVIERPRPVFYDKIDTVEPSKDDQNKAKNFSEENDVKFMNFVDNVAKEIDSACFRDEPDPMTEILERLMSIYEASCREPRLMNETLLSSVYLENETVDTVTTRHSLPIPIPEFFEKAEKSQHRPSQSLKTVERTADIFKTSPLRVFSLDDSIFNTSPVEDFDFFSEKLFKSPARENSLFQPGPSTILKQNYNFSSPRNDDEDLFAFSPLRRPSMDWEEQNYQDEREKFDSTFAIFHSPPRHQRPKRLKPSQRKKNEDLFGFLPDVTVSTTKWNSFIQNSSPAKTFDNSFLF